MSNNRIEHVSLITSCKYLVILVFCFFALGRKLVQIKVYTDHAKVNAVVDLTL